MSVMETRGHNHADAHGHEHEHPHQHWPAGETPPAGGPIVLDIGGDTGALIVHVTTDMEGGGVGHELHVRSEASQGETIHTGIWRRAVGGRDVVVAVFAELKQGNYEILHLDGSQAATVHISGGSVAEMTVDLLHY